jgi:hypothetical protein
MTAADLYCADTVATKKAGQKTGLPEGERSLPAYGTS